ncbi:hypothetical protein [Granulicella mallensis]|uniref:Uncharacterized protein n=1 Tax=Granulicella mallensis (strain ATCC BAA-1857 / DSM 23137 / MP5ACTX8) TaxID=682795 RepID=G8NPM5_GRAMM|nr:hypothetical protein [Granulicella mallensis]AEU36037.1 hypothetical protein AciX8_1698 [Granulicella mallensis MP5ACTX8]
MKTRFPMSLLGAIFCLVSLCPVVHADTSADCNALAQGRSLPVDRMLISSDHLPPSATTNMKSVTVCRMNIFRYSMQVQTQAVINNPPSPPANLFSAVSGSGVSSNIMSVTTASPTSAAELVQPQSGLPASPSSDPVSGFQQQMTNAQNAAEQMANDFAANQIEAGKKVACYSDLANLYPAVLLTQTQEQGLIARLKASDACSVIATAIWDDSKIAAVEAEVSLVIALNGVLATFETTSAYQDYLTAAGTNADARKAAFAAFFTTNAATIAQLEGLINPTNIATYNATVRTGTDWDARAKAALDIGDPWDQTLDLTCRVQWFGKIQSDTVTLPYIDYAQATPTPGVSPAFSFTNACLSSLTVSTGLGISTVRSSTYGFVPQTNYALMPPITTQVIGYATDSRITPFYVGQMNYSYLHPERSIGLHVAGGAGVGTSSSGTTGDFFIGNAFSFFHREIFVTPSVHFTQRQQLLNGYQIGDVMGSLSSVPTINNWKTGFAITITLPVLQQ